MERIEKFEVHRFDGKDFFLWKFQMKVFLSGQEMWEVVDGSEACPVPAVANEPTADEVVAITTWKKKNNKSMMYLTQALSKGQLAKVINCDSSKAIWDRLCAVHEQKDETSIHMVQQQFFDYRMENGDDVSTHIAKVESLARRLKDLGEAQSDTAVITKILWTLPPTFRSLVSAWDSTPADERTLQNLTARLLKEEEMNKKVASHSQDDKAETFVAHGGGHRQRPSSGRSKPKNGKFTGECNHCKKKGHKIVDCWEKISRKEAPAKRICKQHTSRSFRHPDGIHNERISGWMGRRLRCD